MTLMTMKQRRVVSMAGALAASGPALAADPGASYASYLNALPSVAIHENGQIDQATGCAIPALSGSALECRSSSAVHVWGELDFGTRKAAGDSEAAASRSKRLSALVGADARLSNAMIVGGSAGYVSDRLNESASDDSVKGEGWTAGLYAAFDPGPLFVKGVAAYGRLNGRSERGTADLAATRGEPDAKLWSFGLHGGARLPMGANSVVTPFLDYDYVHARMDGFAERGSSGLERRFSSAATNHSFVTAGGRWATDLGGVVPEAMLAYRYRFGSGRARIGEACLLATGSCALGIESASDNKGTVLAGFTVGGKLGRADLRIGYEGEFSGDVTGHGGMLRLVVRIGGGDSGSFELPPELQPPPDAPPAPEAPAAPID